jgi:aspartate/methionine/tyrosine aminotransferase
LTEKSQLCDIWYSYLERITSQFAYQKEICQKASLLAVDHTQKLKEVIQDQEKLEKQVKIMIKTTNNMKHLVCCIFCVQPGVNNYYLGC